MRDEDAREVQQREHNRAVLQKALKLARLPVGVNDDEFTCDVECGVRIGSSQWSLCYVEMYCGGPDGVVLLHDEDGEHEYGPGLPGPRMLSSWIQRIVKEHSIRFDDVIGEAMK